MLKRAQGWRPELKDVYARLMDGGPELTVLVCAGVLRRLGCREITLVYAGCELDWCDKKPPHEWYGMSIG